MMMMVITATTMDRHLVPFFEVESCSIPEFFDIMMIHVMTMTTGTAS